MRRSAFKAPVAATIRAAREARQIGVEYTLRPRAMAVDAVGPDRSVVAVPKRRPAQHQGYMDAVRQLPCYRCGVVGLTQFCHADEGKGMGLKTDCRLGWPGCGPRGNIAGCHWQVGTSGRHSRAERRIFEALAGADTRETIHALGQWPATLPRWASR